MPAWRVTKVGLELLKRKILTVLLVLVLVLSQYIVGIASCSMTASGQGPIIAPPSAPILNKTTSDGEMMIRGDPDWYNTDWGYRTKITIDHSKVEDVADPSTTYADFPVLVYATGLSNIKDAGADIRFTSSDGTTELPREIESYSDGTLYAWVKVTLTQDSSDVSDDVIYMYYGNSETDEPAPSSDYGSQKVWDSNFKMVQHLRETTGGTDAIKDSTSNNNDGTDFGNPTLGVSGKIVNAIQFDGIDNYIDCGADGSLNFTSGVTLEAWVEKASPVKKSIAEFEPMQGVFIQYDGSGFAIPYELIAEMSRDVQIVTIVADSTEQSEVESLYRRNGVNCAEGNCTYLMAPSETEWTRDYGPWFIFNETDEYRIVNFTYFGYDDNRVPEEYATWRGIDVDLMDLTHVGGDYMTDGHGIAISTGLVTYCNSDKTPAQVDQEVLHHLGIDTYYKIYIYQAYRNGWTFIAHIDCWAKLLAPDKIMIINVAESHPHYNELNDIAAWFGETVTTCYGGHYTVYRVDSDPANGEAYINCLILNDKVLLPFTGDSSRDNAAKKAFENAMPGYEVLGFEALPGKEWLGTAALHCRTLGIPVETPWDYDYIVSKGEDAYNLQMNRVGSSLHGYISNNEIMTSTSQPMDWHHYALTFDGTDLKLFIDGVLKDTTSPGKAVGLNATRVTIGGSEPKGYFSDTLKDKGYFSGTLDEVRVSNTARSYEWIKTSYNNQNDPSAFHTVGSEERFNGRGE